MRLKSFEIIIEKKEINVYEDNNYPTRKLFQAYIIRYVQFFTKQNGLKRNYFRF